MALFFWLSWLVLSLITSVLIVRELIRDKKQHAQIGTVWTRGEELLFYWLGTAQLLVMFCLHIHGCISSAGGLTAGGLLTAILTTTLIPQNSAVIGMIIIPKILKRSEKKSAAPAEPFKFTAGMKLVCAALVIVVAAATLACRYGALGAGTALVIMLLSTVIAQGVFLILLRKKPKHPTEPEDDFE